MRNMIVLITGGTGSLGRAVIESLIEKQVMEIRVMARSEKKIIELKRLYENESCVKPFIGDIRDIGRVMALSNGCDVIIHLAALKHVSICETMPVEAVQTNIIGTMNVIESAKSCGVKKVIYASTDKAVNSNCVYGSTKLLGEKLILAANGLDTKFIVFRCGNLYGSSGSVIPLFKEQIRQHSKIHITDERMTRFFIPIRMAADTLVEIIKRGNGGEIFLPKMDALSIYHIAKHMLDEKELDEAHIKHIGVRPGEKIDEDMLTVEEEKSIYEISENLCVVLKDKEHPWIKNDFVKREMNYPMTSKDALMDYDRTIEFIQKQEMSQ